MIREQIELKGSVEVAKGVEKHVHKAGVRGLDMEKARELGFFTRLSNILCACHATIVAAYHIYGYADYMLTDYGCRRHEISRAMNEYEKAFDRFFSFWTDYYAHGAAGREMNEESEELYHRIMEWASLPEKWELGDEQRLAAPHEAAIKLTSRSGRELYLKSTTAERETIGEVKESWCITKYNELEHKQEVVDSNMNKADAMMLAKILSEQDKDNIYTANIIQDITERRTQVTPFKAYYDNKVIGKLVNVESK